MNDDLIYRSALKEHIGSYAGMFTDELGFVVSLEAVLRGIDFATAVDAVEVVRCKNCDHCHWYTKLNHLIGTQESEYWCNNGKGRPREVKPDDFCSYGERKSDE